MSSLGRHAAFVRERVKGFLVSCSQAGEDGPPLCPPSVQRLWGSGVCRERLCGVTGLLWLGRPALLPPPHPTILFSRLLPLFSCPTEDFLFVRYCKNKRWFLTKCGGCLFKKRCFLCSFLSLGVNFSSYLQTVSNNSSMSDKNHQKKEFIHGFCWIAATIMFVIAHKQPRITWPVGD